MCSVQLIHTNANTAKTQSLAYRKCLKKNIAEKMPRLFSHNFFHELPFARQEQNIKIVFLKFIGAVGDLRCSGGYRAYVREVEEVK